MTYDEALALGLWFYNINVDVYCKSLEAADERRRKHEETVDPAWKEATAEVLSVKKEEG